MSGLLRVYRCNLLQRGNASALFRRTSAAPQNPCNSKLTPLHHNARRIKPRWQAFKARVVHRAEGVKWSTWVQILVSAAGMSGGVTIYGWYEFKQKCRNGRNYLLSTCSTVCKYPREKVNALVSEWTGKQQTERGWWRKQIGELWAKGGVRSETGDNGNPKVDGRENKGQTSKSSSNTWKDRFPTPAKPPGRKINRPLEDES